MPPYSTGAPDREQKTARPFAQPTRVGRWGRCLRDGALLTALVAATALADPDPRVQELAEHPEKFPQVLREMRERYRQEVRHYSARLFRRQNKSETPKGLSKVERIRFRMREQGGPWAVYMYWEKGPNEGLEALYAQGQYEDKVWVKPPWLRPLPPFSFTVDDPVIMKENRHPITKAGIGRLMDSLLQQCELAELNGDAASAFQYQGPREVSGRPTLQIVRELPHRPGYYCWKAVVELDLEWGYPVKITTVNWKGVILEQIIYEDVKWNEESLTDDQFDKDKVFSILKVLGP
jgi:hypothetical protein